jgi:outer membrane receptor for ferric coprogen and ferric-rhodotorulic acid
VVPARGERADGPVERLSRHALEHLREDRYAARATRIALNIENLLDRKYFSTVDGDNNITPGAPRTLRLTLSTAF